MAEVEKKDTCLNIEYLFLFLTLPDKNAQKCGSVAPVKKFESSSPLNARDHTQEFP